MNSDQLRTSNYRLPKGYKQTEIGVIPEDWTVRRIGSFGDVVRGGSPRPAGDPRFFNGSYIPWLTVASLTNIPEHQLDVREAHGGLTEEGAKHSRTLEYGTVIIANSGATLGVAKLLNIKCCANDGIAALINQKNGDKRYLCHFINTKTKELRDVIATGNGQPNLNTTLIEEILVPFPPLEEQRSIAQALSDVDALIAALDKLIAKKRNLKTATMQQLLTGKKRLPGFGEGQGYKQTEVGVIPEDWVVIELGDVLKIRHGKSQQEVVAPNGIYPILATGGEIGRTNTPLYSQPSILIGRKGTIDIPKYMDTPFWTVDTLFYSEIFKNANAKFIFYKFNLIDWYSYNEASGVPSLNAATIENIEQAFPTLKKEQEAIATILSDIDAEIAALETRLAKTQALKQGMMQELLTGRTRLV